MADELPFSQTTLDLFRQVQNAKTKEDRKRLIMELGEQFASEYDPSDESATDDYHNYFDEFVQAKLVYDQARMRVGRLAAHLITEIQKPGEAQVTEHPTVN